MLAKLILILFRTRTKMKRQRKIQKNENKDDYDFTTGTLKALPMKKNISPKFPSAASYDDFGNLNVFFCWFEAMVHGARHTSLVGSYDCSIEF